MAVLKTGSVSSESVTNRTKKEWHSMLSGIPSGMLGHPDSRVWDLAEVEAAW